MSKFVLDTEIIGLEKPVFLVCIKNIETQEVYSFWHHKKRDKQNLTDILLDPNNVFITFNGMRFDAPLLSLYLYGHDVEMIKKTATRIIEHNIQAWQHPFKQVEFNHIDLIDVAPGVMISLKTYAGRMQYPSMIDLPFHHDKDLSPKQRKVLEMYCFNDLGVTEALYRQLTSEIALREELGVQHGLELRSKSDPQVAEAILKKELNIGKRTGAIPDSVRYTKPKFIKITNPALKRIIQEVEDHEFLIDRKNNSPILPDWMEVPIALGGGQYQMGIGGLHSKHDQKVCHRENDQWLISDFDAASYYPAIILKCGLIPQMGGDKGEKFIKAYRDIFDRRLKAKREGDKKTANSLKISLNGVYGKLGSHYSPFYAPDLMLAVTLTGQLNLLWLISALTEYENIHVLSANTDGITVGYSPKMRGRVLEIFEHNAAATGFEYEETKYKVLAMKDVNNYIAVTTDNKVKAKGLYAEAGVKPAGSPGGKNPTMQVCSRAVAQHLVDGRAVDDFIERHTDFRDFTAIRNVKGGGEQRGKSLGRVVRWYMSTNPEFVTFPIQYSSNGNRVPKTEGGRACMELPDEFPYDLDYDWYIKEAQTIMEDIGI